MAPAEATNADQLTLFPLWFLVAMPEKGKGSNGPTWATQKPMFIELESARRLLRWKEILLDSGAMNTRGLKRGIRQIQAVIAGLRNVLVTANEPLAVKLLIRMAGPDYTDEHYSVAMEALMRAVDKFDLGRGFQFSTYAWRAVKSALIRKYQGDMRRLSHERTMTDLGDEDGEPRGLSEPEVDPTEARIEAENSAELARTMQQAMASAPLTDIERMIIRRRFYRDPPETLQDIAVDIGITRERVRQLQQQALEKIKVQLAAAPAE